MGWDPGNPAIGTGGPPSGPAGGDLAGTYPNPTIKASVSLTTPTIGAAKATSLDISGTAPTVAANHLGVGAGTQSTVGAAGGADPVPLTPDGYLIINVGGTDKVIPYYAAS